MRTALFLAAGALSGSWIPLPVAGTVLGAAGGLFVSGAVDSMYQNGVLSVRQAFSGGTEALGDTSRAIGDVAVDVWDAIF